MQSNVAQHQLQTYILKQQATSTATTPFQLADPVIINAFTRRLQQVPRELAVVHPDPRKFSLYDQSPNRNLSPFVTYLSLFITKLSPIYNYLSRIYPNLLGIHHHSFPIYFKSVAMRWYLSFAPSFSARWRERASFELVIQ